MSQELTLRIITPEKVVLDTTVASVRVPATDGSMGIFPRHARMVAALGAGELFYKVGGQETELFISDGFAEVRDNTVRVLTSAGEKPEEIDPERAKAAEERARERLRAAAHRETQDDLIDMVRAEAALRRALMRLQVRSHQGF